MVVEGVLLNKQWQDFVRGVFRRFSHFLNKIMKTIKVKNINIQRPGVKAGSATFNVSA